MEGLLARSLHAVATVAVPSSTYLACLRAMALFALIFGAAYLIRVAIVPNVMPIADTEQPGWQLQFAFVVKAIENVGLFGMIIALLLALYNWLRELLRDAAPD
jgi:hypothetical protein